MNSESNSKLTEAISPSDPESLRAIAGKLGIHTAKRHLFLCADQTKPKCCDKEASLESWNYLK